MNRDRTVALYRALLRAYPHRFRDEYAQDMAELFAAQLRDESTARVCVRAVIDLAITVPARHLEDRMNQPVERTASAHWWKLTGVGATMLAVIIVVTAMTGELPDGWWRPVMTVSLISVLLIVTGVVLGIARLVSRAMPRS